MCGRTCVENYTLIYYLISIFGIWLNPELNRIAKLEQNF